MHVHVSSVNGCKYNVTYARIDALAITIHLQCMLLSLWFPYLICACIHVRVFYNFHDHHDSSDYDDDNDNTNE